MSTVPTPPTFAANDSSLANLQALAACAQFLGVADSAQANTLPLWHFYMASGTAGISAATLTAITTNSNAVDTDGVFSASGSAAKIVTRGYYRVETTYCFGGTATNTEVRVFCKLVTGSSNPLGSGLVFPFALNSMATGVTSADDFSISAGDVTPIVCYPNDVITHYVTLTSGLNLKTGVIPFGNTGRCYTTFSGRWVRSG